MEWQRQRGLVSQCQEAATESRAATVQWAAHSSRQLGVGECPQRQRREQWRVHTGAAHTCDMSSPCCSDSLSTRRHLNCKANGLGGRSEAVLQCGSVADGWVVRWAEGVGQI